MANDDGPSACERWIRTVVEKTFQRFRSLGHLPVSVFLPTPMPPPEVMDVTRFLANFWPVPQSRRDGFAAILAQCMAGHRSSFALFFGAIPEPEASLAAAAAESEGFAAASAYAAGKPAATDEERCHLYQFYVKEVWMSAYRYAIFRHYQAAGTSSAGTPAQPPTAASVPFAFAFASGPVQQLGQPSASAPAAPEE